MCDVRTINHIGVLMTHCLRTSLSIADRNLYRNRCVRVFQRRYSIVVIDNRPTIYIVVMILSYAGDFGLFPSLLLFINFRHNVFPIPVR